MQPGLTTVAQPYLEMGALAVKTLTGILRGEMPKTPHTKFRCQVIERGSVAAVSANPSARAHG